MGGNLAYDIDMQGSDQGVSEVTMLIHATLKDTQEGNVIKILANHPIIRKWESLLFEIFSRLDHEFGVFDSYDLPELSENGLYYSATINSSGLTDAINWIQSEPGTVIYCGDVILDLSKAKLSIGGTELGISPEHDAMKFFSLLLKNPNHVQKYAKIAKSVGYDKKVPKEERVKADFQREMNYLRRRLRGYLLSVGFSNTLVESVMERVKSSRNLGYVFSLD